MTGRSRPVRSRSRAVLVDSSGFLALSNPNDRYFTEACAAWEKLTVEGWHVFTTSYVVAETHALFLIRLGRHRAAAFLRRFPPDSDALIRVQSSDEARARDIIFRYDDKDFSLTDATSFAVMERLGVDRAFAFDRHFAQYGFTIV